MADILFKEGGSQAPPPSGYLALYAKTNDNLYVRNSAGTEVAVGTANTGTVTSVSVTTGNGVSGVVTNATTTPAIAITLGAITPTSVNGNFFTTGSSTYTGTAGQTYTFPSTSATIARTDALQTFTGVQTFSSTIAGNISGNAATVTTNANLTGVITSVGNATSIASQTGTGTKFVVDTSPTLVTPVLGTPTSGVLSGCTGYAQSALTGLAAGVSTFLGTPSSANLIAAMTDETGTGACVFGTSPTFTTSVIGGASFDVYNTVSTTINAFGAATTLSIGAATGTMTVNNTTLAAKAGTFSTTLGVTGHTTFEGVTSTGATGTGKLVYDTSPTLATPVLGTPSSGTLSSCTIDGTNKVGYLGLPQNSQNAGYTLVLGDAGKHINMATAGTFTIPANGSVAFIIGTAVTFYNPSAACTIPITTDTLVWSPAGTTGTRNIAQYGCVTILKVASTTWVITGSGIT